MNSIILDLPDPLHDRVRELARRDGISVNQFIAAALAEKISAMMTANYLEKRARRGDRDSFSEVLAKVRDVAPDEADKL
jgi:hypothetical protein